MFNIAILLYWREVAGCIKSEWKTCCRCWETMTSGLGEIDAGSALFPLDEACPLVFCWFRPLPIPSMEHCLFAGQGQVQGQARAIFSVIKSTSGGALRAAANMVIHSFVTIYPPPLFSGFRGPTLQVFESQVYECDRAINIDSKKVQGVQAACQKPPVDIDVKIGFSIRSFY